MATVESAELDRDVDEESPRPDVEKPLVTRVESKDVTASMVMDRCRSEKTGSSTSRN